MTEPTTRRMPFTSAQVRRALPLLAALLLLLAAWLAWSGWRQQQDSAGGVALQQARDATVQQTAAVLAEARERFGAQLATPAVQSALAGGDLAAAGTALATGWAGAEDTAVLPVELDAAYAAAAAGEGSYGRLAALEGALVADGVVTTVIRDGDAAALVLSAPARTDQGTVGVAYAQLPLAGVTAPLLASSPGEGAYLALRQGSYTIAEQGDDSLAHRGETLAVKIPDSQLRVAAASPDAATGPFGLGAMACFIAAGVLALLALVALLRWHRPQAAAAETEDEADAPLTLAEALAQPPRAAAPAVDRDPAAPAPAGAAAGAASVDRGIFRAYDIRGIVGQSLDRRVAEQIGQAIGTVMHAQGLAEIVVGRDGRLSGPDMLGGLVDGLRRAGRNVTDIGVAPTPVTYFAAYHLLAGSCVSVTGSHNPPDYNGFKIVLGGETLSGESIVALYTLIAEGRLYEAEVEGTLQQRSVDDDYVNRIASDVQLDRPLRVVVDAGNGVAGGIAPRVLSAIGAEVTPLYCEVDGNFPNHHPDPSEPENLVDLIDTVRRLGADLGIAFDGDGDRLGVVTREGNNIFADRLLMLFADDVLERNPGAVIVYDVKCTGRLAGQVLRAGGSPLMWKTGHSLIKAKMRETGAELAGEMSGHFFFKERWYGFDDAIYAAARLLEILAGRTQPPAEVLDALPDGVSTPEIKVPAPGGDPHAFVDRFRDAAQFDGARLSTIDGLRVDWPDGWGLVRASNTTPVLVLRFDADDAQALERIQANFRQQLLALDPDLPLGF
ncbi:MAG TPA: phosphomannomutase/phosphoglucomutase [Xanthomonadaceae bacterium]|nr:phosphomannomutase/phosphoglucomutase [Xanthomonadaceae bacterium]